MRPCRLSLLLPVSFLVLHQLWVAFLSCLRCLLHHMLSPYIWDNTPGCSGASQSIQTFSHVLPSCRQSVSIQANSWHLTFPCHCLAWPSEGPTDNLCRETQGTRPMNQLAANHLFISVQRSVALAWRATHLETLRRATRRIRHRSSFHRPHLRLQPPPSSHQQQGLGLGQGLTSSCPKHLA